MRALLLVASLTVGLGGCVSTSETPEWFADRAAENDSSYPSLRSVPREHQADTDSRRWAAIARDLRRQRSIMEANERSQPAPADAATQAEAFVEEAQRDIEETRQSHEPN